MKKFSVIIRTFNEQEKLPRLFESLKRQSQLVSEVIIIDSGSTDQTLSIAKKCQAKIIRIPHGDFSYAYSLNVGLEAAEAKNIAVFSAHSLPVYDNCLKIAASYLDYDKVAGVYGPCLADSDASLTERLCYSINLVRLYRKPVVLESSRMGIMGNTNSFFRRVSWQKHRFDLDMGEGGEDAEWALYWLGKGYKFIFEPKTAVYHSYGLTFGNFLDQFKHWQKVYGKALDKYN